MKQLFKQAMATLGLLSLILVVIFSTIATISGDSGTLRTLLMGGELRLKSGARLTAYGTSYIKTGDTTLFKAGKTIARLDSFTTTAVTDTVLWKGVRRGDVISVTPFEPDYSSVADTGSGAYSARLFTTGTDTIVVARAKRTAASTLKSAAIYSISVYSKQ